MTAHELGRLAARQRNVPGHLKQAYAEGFAGALEKRAGDSGEFSGILKSLRSSPDGITATPREALTESYTPRNVFGNVTGPSRLPQRLPQARAYREANPGTTWTTGIDDATLDKPVRVAFDPNETDGGRYYPRDHRIGLKDHGGLQRHLMGTIFPHEIAHTMQREHLLSDDSRRYDAGLAPSDLTKPDNGRVAWIRGSAAYHLDPVEIEARLRGVVNEAFMRGQNVTTPQEARDLLQRRLIDTESPHAGGLKRVVNLLTPEQKENFIKLWSGRMPGLVHNRHRPAKRMKIAQQKNAGYCR